MGAFNVYGIINLCLRNQNAEEKYGIIRKNANCSMEV